MQETEEYEAWFRRKREYFGRWQHRSL